MHGHPSDKMHHQMQRSGPQFILSPLNPPPSDSLLIEFMRRPLTIIDSYFTNEMTELRINSLLSVIPLVNDGAEVQIRAM